MVTDTSKEKGARERDEEKDAIEEDSSPAESATEEAAKIVTELEGKLQEEKTKYLYLYSEFENFRRRVERDRIEFLKFGHEHFLKDLLLVLDNFERAIEQARSVAEEKGSVTNSVLQGIEMIHFQLLESLKSQGVKPIETANAKFDPKFHEAIAEEENGEPGTIVKEHQKGYLLHDRLLRAAKVVVGKKKA